MTRVSDQELELETLAEEYANNIAALKGANFGLSYLGFKSGFRAAESRYENKLGRAVEALKEIAKPSDIPESWRDIARFRKALALEALREIGETGEMEGK